MKLGSNEKKKAGNIKILAGGTTHCQITRGSKRSQIILKCLELVIH